MYASDHKEKFYQELRKTSEKIKSIISEYDTKQKEKILIQEIVSQQQYLNSNIQPNKIPTKNIIFKNSTTGITTILRTEIGTTMKELFKRYIREVYGITKKKISFVFDSKKIEREDQEKLKKFLIIQKHQELLPLKLKE